MIRVRDLRLIRVRLGVLTSIPGYLSWRKLGDVAASLYALGYHQQQTESFRTAPSFLRDLRQTAFCRTYSADKNVSIFLGRPPRILRKFCYFHLPGTLAQPNQKAGRTPAVWDPSEKPSFATDSKWAALCGILKEDILDLFAEESYEERARQGQYVPFRPTCYRLIANSFILKTHRRRCSCSMGCPPGELPPRRKPQDMQSAASGA